MEQVILAIDPGKIKCGIAIVDNELHFIAGKVINRIDLIDEIRIIKEEYKIRDIAIGSGTASKNLFNSIKEHFSDINL